MDGGVDVRGKKLMLRGGEGGVMSGLWLTVTDIIISFNSQKNFSEN